MEEDMEEELSALMRQSMVDGKFWFNELINSSFLGPDAMPWVKLRAMLPLDHFATVSEGEVDQFNKMKMEHLDIYNSRWAELQKEIARQEVEVQAFE